MGKNKIDVNDIKGDVLGASVSGTGNTVVKEEYKGTVVQNQFIISKGTDISAVLKQINSISLGTQSQDPAGLNSNKTPNNINLLMKEIEKLNNAVKEIEKQGNIIEEIRSADQSISRKELNIKKAILLKTEADQLWSDHVNKRRNELGRNENDINELKQGFNYIAYQKKLMDAYTLLESENIADPTDTEVLLNMAKLLMVLTPDDPSDEEKLLIKIQNLLNEPKNDAEKFRLAQANLLLSISRKPINLDGVRSARKMLYDLGRTEWLEYVDALIKANPEQVTNTSEVYKPTTRVFNPAGRWHVKIGDLMGSIMMVDLNQNGTFIANQTSFGMMFNGNGNWSYDPRSRSLFMQGILNGFQPFMLQIMIQNDYQGGFAGIGADGYMYNFTMIT